MKKILFISHEASRTGAPLILLQVIKWFQEYEPNIEIHLLVLRPGVLTSTFRKEVDHYYDLSQKNKTNLSNRIKNKIFTKQKASSDEMILSLSKKDFDIVYANTVIAVPWGCRIKNLDNKIKFVAHIHELDIAINMVQPDFNNLVGDIDSFIAVSELVSDMLKSKYLVPSEDIHLVYEFIKHNGHEKNANKQEFVVGGSGTVSWRKGNDLFINIAKYIDTHHKEAAIKFYWVGSINEKDRLIIEGDLFKAGIADRVKFLGELEDPSAVYSNFDIFLLTSREDPFPLACIEIADYAVPTICFEKASGITEILKKGGGAIVPYLDIITMAKKIIYYYEHPEQIKMDGEKAKELFKDFRAEIQCPKIFAILNNLITNA